MESRACQLVMPVEYVPGIHTRFSLVGWDREPLWRVKMVRFSLWQDHHSTPTSTNVGNTKSESEKVYLLCTKCIQSIKSPLHYNILLLLLLLLLLYVLTPNCSYHAATPKTNLADTFIQWDFNVRYDTIKLPTKEK